MKLLILLTSATVAYTADPAAGKKLFESKCSICHAPDSSEHRIGPGLKGVKEGKLPSGKHATHASILKQIEDGGGGMPVFRQLLTKEQKDDIAAYVMTL